MTGDGGIDPSTQRMMHSMAEEVLPTTIEYVESKYSNIINSEAAGDFGEQLKTMLVLERLEGMLIGLYMADAHDKGELSEMTDEEHHMVMSKANKIANAKIKKTDRLFHE